MLQIDGEINLVNKKTNHLYKNKSTSYPALTCQHCTCCPPWIKDINRGDTLYNIIQTYILSVWKLLFFCWEQTSKWPHSVQSPFGLSTCSEARSSHLGLLFPGSAGHFGVGTKTHSISQRSTSLSPIQHECELN